MSIHRLLIVHPDPSDRALILSMIQSLGHRLEEACHENAAMRLLEQSPIDVVIAAANPAHPDWLEFLNYLRRKYPSVPVVLIFPAPHHDRQREAMQRGALAVVRFPAPATQLRALVAQALGVPEANIACAPRTPSPHPLADDRRLHSENGVPADPAAASERSPRLAVTQHPAAFGAPMPNDVRVMIGDDPNLRHTLDLAAAIAPTRAPILIQSEAGTGKSVLARFIHARSGHAGGPLIEASCDSLREGVLEIDLFGRPSDDASGHRGKIARAHGGTLFLREVSALSPTLQLRLLRLLRSGELDPPGSICPARVDVRVIASSRHSLAALVDSGLFRQDLYYALSAVNLRLPSLRQRSGDIETLAEYFRAGFAREIGKPIVGFTPEAHEMLRRYPWPGNVLELENVVERAVIVNRGSWIEPCHLGLHHQDGINVRTVSIPVTAASRIPSSATILPLKEALEEPEKQLILQALEALNWNRQETARVLDINRTTLYKKMKKYELLFDEPIWAN
jgi:two-component system response regulator HydG